LCNPPYCFVRLRTVAAFCFIHRFNSFPLHPSFGKELKSRGIIGAGRPFVQHFLTQNERFWAYKTPLSKVIKVTHFQFQKPPAFKIQAGGLGLLVKTKRKPHPDKNENQTE
jgi:hypothetical protein